MSWNDRISRTLEPGEELRWQGKPRQGLMFRRHDRYLIPFFVLWTSGIAIIGFPGTRADIPFPFFAIPVVMLAFGLYMLFGRFLWDMAVRFRTRYALTNRRALVIMGSPFNRTDEIGITGSTEIWTDENPDGSGSVYFGPRAVRQFGQSSLLGPSMFAFEQVSDARNLLTAIREVTESRS